MIARGTTLVEVPDEEFDTMGANVFAVSPRRCLMVAGNPITRSRLEQAGAEVVEYRGEEISLKGGGGTHVPDPANDAAGLIVTRRDRTSSFAAPAAFLRGALRLEQALLHVHTPAVAVTAPSCPTHAMARHDQRNGYWSRTHARPPEPPTAGRSVERPRYTT